MVTTHLIISSLKKKYTINSSLLPGDPGQSQSHPSFVMLLATSSIRNVGHDPGFMNLTWGHQEKLMNKGAILLKKNASGKPRKPKHPILYT